MVIPANMGLERFAWVYHYYDVDAFGAVKLRVETLTFGKDGRLELN
jgi:hypothetical protein